VDGSELITLVLELDLKSPIQIDRDLFLTIQNDPIVSNKLKLHFQQAQAEQQAAHMYHSMNQDHPHMPPS